MKLCFRINHSFFKLILLKSAAFITALSLFALSLPAQSEAKPWSERKFDRTILSIDKDIRRKRWQSAKKPCLSAYCFTLKVLPAAFLFSRISIKVTKKLTDLIRIISRLKAPTDCLRQCSENFIRLPTALEITIISI